MLRICMMRCWLDLYGDNSADKERNQQHNADRVHAELPHFVNVLAEEHTHTLWSGKSTPHQHDVSSDSFKCFYHDS